MGYPFICFLKDTAKSQSVACDVAVPDNEARIVLQQSLGLAPVCEEKGEPSLLLLLYVRPWDVETMEEKRLEAPAPQSGGNTHSGRGLGKQEGTSAVHLATYKQIVHLHMDELGYISQWRAIFAGGLAGISAALATYPLEVAETRLIAQNCREPTYRGVVHTLSKIYQTEGLRALYRGFSLTVLGAFPFSIGCYAVYINLDKLWREPQFRFTPLQNFINGCVAAGIAQTFSYPFETVKRKMQAQNPRLPHYGGADVHFTGMLDCFRQVIRNKGILTLWSGITANMVKIVPYFGLLFSCFEMCKQVCLYRNGYIVSPLSYKLAPGVDQSMGPTEVEEVKRYLKNRNFQSQQGSRW
ncbi:hypothetical protein J4Q44_G00314780 [Coregonus suidteri]|uniref:Solute carrier family 25 member 43 n=1 Tax=Coregonus suidteri TaxID=861788 RepID=A0AAN8KV53_9TELE